MISHSWSCSLALILRQQLIDSLEPIANQDLINSVRQLAASGEVDGSLALLLLKQFLLLLKAHAAVEPSAVAANLAETGFEAN